MAFIWIDKKDGEDFILASDINGIAKELINIGKDSAKKDLSNVDNETFKAKAEEAGVGGDNAELFGDAPMVFKGVVSELPETANEGDVIRAPYGKVGSFTNCYGFLNIYPDHIEGYAFAEEIMVGMINILNETSESEKPISFNIKLSDWDGNVVGSYTIHATSHSYDGDRYYIYGETDAPDPVFVEGGETVTVERENAPYKTVVRFNGEWVEL